MLPQDAQRCKRPGGGTRNLHWGQKKWRSIWLLLDTLLKAEAFYRTYNRKIKTLRHTSPYIIWNIQKKLARVSDDLVHDPGKGNKHGDKNGENFGDKGKGHFLNLCGRLNDAHHQAHDKAYAQHGQGYAQGKLNALPGKAYDEFRTHNLP
jgi:hypothetical protein